MDADSKKAFELRDEYFGVMNSLKAYEGHLAGLRDAAMMAKMKERDEELIAKSGKPEVKEAFALIAEEMGKLHEKFAEKDADPQAMMQSVVEVQRRKCGPAKSTINQARFDVYGTALYPDANFTLRLTFGTVKGYEAGTTMVPPKTTLNGLYERNAAFD